MLLVGRSRSTPRWAFGAFAALWGFQIFAGNVARLLGPGPSATTWTFLLVASLVVLYVPLVYFISVYPGERKLFARSTPAALLLLAPAAFGSLALVLRPEWFHLGFDASGSDLWGPLIPLFAALYFGAFDYAVWVLSTRYRSAGTTIESRQLLLFLAAFSLYLSYVSFEDLPLYGIPLTQGALPPSSLAPALAFLALSLVGCALLVRIAFLILREGTPRARLFVGAAVALPGLMGALSGVTGALGADLDTIGLFRTASVVLIAYAILRYELFDIDVKVKRGALVAGILVLAALVAIGVEQALERAVGSTGLAITLTQFTLVGAVVAVVMKAPAAARALGGRVLPALDAPDRLDARRLEVYEAALAQAAAAQGGIDAGAPFLADLRARLGVSESEHALLARLVAPRAAQAHAQAQAQALDAGALVAGRYRLERLLGEGSAGAAWLARDETLARRVVVKTLHARLVRNDEATRAFLREARVAASLDHENVVRVFDFGTSGDTPFLVMELVEGGSLEERLAGGHALPPAVTRAVVGGILAGLAHVHARGVLHRDLKPANVLLAADGTPKITDFGVALAASVPGAAAHETHTGLEPAPLPKGTLATMSPEAVRGLPLSPASDVYGVGAILYRCVAGQPYLRLEGRSRESARAAILGEPPLPAPQGAPADLVRVALRALEKEPARRYHSADEMQEALDAQLVVAV